MAMLACGRISSIYKKRTENTNKLVQSRDGKEISVFEMEEGGSREVKR